MTHPGTRRVLVVDDEIADQTARELRDQFDGLDVEIIEEANFDEAERRLSTEPFDVVVLDVMRQRKSGTPEDLARGARTFELLRQGRFLPVVFYTAKPDEVEAFEQPPLIRVVVKDEPDAMVEAVKAALSSGVQDVVRALRDHVDTVVRDFMWDQVAPNGDAYRNEPGETARILASRIAQTLESESVDDLVRELSASAFSARPPEPASEGSPATYYLYPPVASRLDTAGVLRGPLPVTPTGENADEVDPTEHWSVILTPACDLEQNKADWLLVAQATVLGQHHIHLAYEAAANSRNKDKLRNLLRGGLPRYFFLPAFRDIPDLVVDLEHTHAVRVDEATATLHQIATLDSPYAEALLARHAHFRGRIGFPDISDEVLTRIIG